MDLALRPYSIWVCQRRSWKKSDAGRLTRATALQACQPHGKTCILITMYVAYVVLASKDDLDANGASSILCWSVCDQITHLLHRIVLPPMCALANAPKLPVPPSADVT